MTASSASRVDPKLAAKAVEALLNHHAKKSSGKDQLLGNDKVVTLQFGLIKVPGSPSPRPIRIAIPHPIWKTSDDDDEDELENPAVCIIVKEGSKEWVQDMIAAHPKEMGMVKKVLGLDSLRKKHARFEQQRALLSRFDVFLADDRILPMLGKALGKKFFEQKKQPIPLRLTRKTSVPFSVLQAMQSTFMFVSMGTCISIKIGTTSMKQDKLVKNICAVAEAAAMKIPKGKWANVCNISIKTPESTSLPLYNKLPEELIEIAKLAGIHKEEKEALPPKANKNKEQNKDDKSQKAKSSKSKSPLLKALKKQQAAEKVSPKKRKVADKEKEDQPPKKKSSEKLVVKATSGEGDAIVGLESPKRKNSPKESGDENPTSAKKGRSRKDSKDTVDMQVDEESPKKRKTKGDAAKEVEKPSSSKKGRKESKTEEAEKKSTESKSFIASKKFKGSKKGYVFHSGKQGLGYYVDNKPVVDKMVLEAFSRMGQRKSPGSSGKKKRKGRR